MRTVKNIGIVILISISIMLFLGYFGQIGMTADYYGTWIFVITLVSISTAVAVDNKIDAEKITLTPIKIIAILITIVMIVLVIFTSTMTKAEEYSSLLNTKEVKLASLEIEAMETRTSTKRMALKAANKVLGTKHNDVMISSQYSVDEDAGFIQVINNKMVWVFPLDFRGFFKWINQDYVPGYILVSATNDNAEATIVLNSKIKYSSNGFFTTNIERKLWIESGFKSVNSHIEINEKGEVYYIGTILKPSIGGLSAHVIEEVIVFNAETGEKEILSVQEVEKKHPWIDRIIPEETALERINWYGSLQNGWLNSITTGENVKEATSYEGAELWFTKINGKNYWFTGMTSNTSADQSLVEAILVDTKTGEGYVVELSGVTDERGATQQAEASLGADSVKWDAVLPQPQFINGEFYWICTIKSDSDLYQKVVAVKGNETTVTYQAKDVKELINKIKNETKTFEEGEEETIVLNKKVYLELLKQIEKVNQLAKKLK